MRVQPARSGRPEWTSLECLLVTFECLRVSSNLSLKADSSRQWKFAFIFSLFNHYVDKLTIGFKPDTQNWIELDSVWSIRPGTQCHAACCQIAALYRVTHNSISMNSLCKMTIIWFRLSFLLQPTFLCGECSSGLPARKRFLNSAFQWQAFWQAPLASIGSE